MYELVDGREILGPEAAGMKLPVPPQEIRERVRLPRKYHYDCLHKDRAEEYATSYRDLAIRYVKGFPHYAHFGLGPVFAGPARTGTSKIAAAVSHEILMRYGSAADMTIGWLSGFWTLRMILDAKTLGSKESYVTLRNQMFNHALLVVDDLLSAVDTEGGRNFVETVYAFRADHGLPTVTTITTPEAGSDIEALVQKAYGKGFASRLLEQAKNLTINI